ncbi:MAG TPA: ABC transporter ATP-binding protein [Candidatus Limnocylindrales bacterium]|nr:ABC transporter ATP-binding protein [Candidatus Limnocylindrales bacterium]
MLEVRGLHAAYETARVLHGVDLSVRAGEVVALLGRNGMGKTTLLRTICGLRPPTVTAGTITYRGRDLTRLRSHEIARLGIGLVPQGRRVFASLTVHENLTVAARRVPNGWDEDTVYELFPRLAERRRQYAGTLSGGEQQMLAIGRALMTNPTLLIMDEPSEGLAPTVRQAILDRIRRLIAAGPAVLLAEQNVDLALAVAGRVSVIGESGTIEWSGVPDELRRDGSILDGLIGL